MSVLPRMKLKNKTADMWIDCPSIKTACQRFEFDCLGRKMEVQSMTLTLGVTIENYRAPNRLNITLSPPSDESSESHVPEIQSMCYGVLSNRIVCRPYSRLHVMHVLFMNNR